MMDLFMKFQLELIAIGFALLFSWGGTEMIKRWMRMLIDNNDDDAVALGARTTALIFGIFGIYMMWPAESLFGWLIPGLVVGFTSPTLYWVMIFLVRKRWPKLADAITGSRR